MTRVESVSSNNEDKIPIASDFDTGTALEYSYTSLTTQDPIWRMWFLNCLLAWMVQAL
jgi:hypothetical protein